MVNNAAIHIIGDIELTSMQQYSKVVDANILGAVRVIKAFLPLVRKSKGKFLGYKFLLPIIKSLYVN